MYTFNATKLEKISTDGAFSHALVGITCSNSTNGRTSYVEITIPKNELTAPINKANIKAAIHNKLWTPNSMGLTLIENLKNSTTIPITTSSPDTLLIGDNSITE